ncbi:unnamed protein product [Owenia fusiformis]|uniref:COP9 signalosome complex subunit 5 n=30 Tax=Protostomia TaxID=33317 RepID=A0A8J1U9Q6_OWEFU|nr:unnamed protein product [Owenia fusiformis]
MSTKMAQKTWEMSNSVENVGTVDEIYRYDKKQQQDILTAKPWEKDPHYFKNIKISALALLKMVMHARSGGNLEVMGLLLGKVDGNQMIVMDSFALPVEGTETRVNAQAQAYEYMAAYTESAKQVGRLENAIGWYHSHPGYGCWLSGIDVSTQMLNQQFQEPFVAIVVDPIRTISAGKVNLGAFRTYPKGYKAPDESQSEYQSIPLNKIEDFGVHCKQYYPLDVSYFKSGLDRRLLESLWNKYWVNTLSSSSLITNADYTTGQIFDLADKLEQSEGQLGRGGFMLGMEDKKSEDKLDKATKDGCKTTMEAIHGLMSQIIKDKLFNQVVLFFTILFGKGVQIRMTGTSYGKTQNFILKMTPEKQDTLLKMVILAIAGILSFSSRLFSVLRFESVIHEFDPYFNYRTTQFLTSKGFYSFHNWFDDRAWYPLGRIIGGTIYPGLMVTSAAFYHVMHFLNITIDIRNVCVFLAPIFSSLTALITFVLTKEIRDVGSGLVAASMIAIVPGYISRSVAGSYDNEGIAIFCMLFTYAMWIKSVKTGSLFWAVICSLAYFYMVSSWGGYVFLINLIPMHVLALMATGRFSHRIYVAYCTVYSIGTLLSMQISFVGFQPIQSSEHMAALGVFGLCQIHAFVDYVRSKLTREQFDTLFRAITLLVGIIFTAIGAILTASGKVAPWTGRFYSLLDPSYAKNNIPIIASVSEHQPTTWSSFYFDLQFLVFLFPAGLYFCFTKLTDANIFIILYGATSIYFAGVMVRLMLVLAPVMCILSGIAVSATLSTYMKNLDASKKATKKSSKVQRGDQNYPVKNEVATGVVFMVTAFLIMYSFHCTWVTSEAYSSPSIVLSARGGDGGRIIFDDFREAYYWLRHNTPEDAKVMSWWDYGYQITAMANRTILVDNNTWNNTHISRVGQAMASTEDKAYEIMRELDVDYVLVIFGGLTGYSSDDINKFLWMVRIGGSTDRGSHIKESDYYTPQGEFRIDKDGSKTLLNCLMYKMCYYRFGAVYTEQGKPTGYDRVRNAEIGYKDFELDVLEEAYTTEHWLVRIYKVKDLVNRGN